MTIELLKLKARDADDIQVVSAILQDAIAPVCDMALNAAENNFIMVVHRLRREAEAVIKEDSLCRERICCAFNLYGVEKAQFQGIAMDRPDDMLELLAVMLEDKSLTFIFAAGARIRLQLGAWSAIIEDFGEPWPAQCSPCHDEKNRLT